jgi:serine/threonine protein kinase
MLEIPPLRTLVPNEIKSLKSLNSPNIIKYLGEETTTNNVYIVTEYCDGGELLSLLNKSGHCNY